MKTEAELNLSLKEVKKILCEDLERSTRTHYETVLHVLLWVTAEELVELTPEALAFN